jgi:hypothetical protein
MAGAFRKSGASMASKMKNRDRAKTDYGSRVEAKKGGKMNAGLKAFLAKKKKKKGKK